MTKKNKQMTGLKSVFSLYTPENLWWCTACPPPLILNPLKWSSWLRPRTATRTTGVCSVTGGSGCLTMQSEGVRKLLVIIYSLSPQTAASLISRTELLQLLLVLPRNEMLTVASLLMQAGITSTAGRLLSWGREADGPESNFAGHYFFFGIFIDGTVASGICDASHKQLSEVGNSSSLQFTHFESIILIKQQILMYKTGNCSLYAMLSSEVDVLALSTKSWPPFETWTGRRGRRRCMFCIVDSPNASFDATIHATGRIRMH